MWHVIGELVGVGLRNGSTAEAWSELAVMVEYDLSITRYPRVGLHAGRPETEG